MDPKWFFGAVDRHGQPLCFSVTQGRFADIHQLPPERLPADAIDLKGALVLPGLVDGHIHLDKSFVGDRWHPHQATTDLRARLANEKAALVGAKPVAQRAEALIRQAASFGTTAMRCHVDVDASTGLENLHGVMQAREACQGIMQIELVAFPQAGVMTCPGTVDVLAAAVDEGAAVVGGIDPSWLDGDAAGQLDAIFGLAQHKGCKIDIHLHEDGDTDLRQLQDIAARTRAAGLNGRVAVSHAFALGDAAPADLDTLLPVLADAGVAIMSNAPGDRSFPPLKKLHEAGVHVFAGNDNIRDSWWPYGNGDLLQRAMLIGYRSGFYTDDELQFALDLVTRASAQVLGLDDYGLKVGAEATFLLLDEPNGAAAVAGVPARRCVVRRGYLPAL